MPIIEAIGGNDMGFVGMTPLAIKPIGPVCQSWATTIQNLSVP
jgi:hypothetical protein